MKIVVVHNNPNVRSGTEKMLQAFLDGIRDKRQVTVEWFDVHRMNIMSCELCNACKTGRIDDCIIRDDMIQVYKAAYEADLILFGFPIVCWHVPGRLKIFIDRLFAMNQDVFTKRQRDIAIFYTYHVEDAEMSGVSEIERFFSKGAIVMNLNIIHDFSAYIPKDGKIENYIDVGRLRELGNQY